MDRWPTVGGSSGGGVEIPSLRARRPRLIVRGLSAVAALGLAVFPVFVATSGTEVLGSVGLVAVGSLIAGVLFESSPAIVLAAFLLGSEYMLSLVFAGAAIDTRAPVIGAGLLLMTELAFWSIELRAPIRDAPAVHLERARAVGALVAGGASVATVPLLVSQLAISGGLLLTALGAAAAVSVAIILARLAWMARNVTS